MATAARDGAEMTQMVDVLREFDNHLRPHKALAGGRPIERYLANPNNPVAAPAPTRQNVCGFLDAGDVV